MQVARKFRELCSSGLFMSLLLVLSNLAVVVVQVSPNFFILGLNVKQILLASIEVMFILARVKSTIAKSKSGKQLFSSVMKSE